MKGVFAADREKTEELFKQSDDFAHKENVKVYRNVQAVVVEEMEKQKGSGEEPLDVLNKSYGNADQLTNEMVRAFVKDLYVFSDSRVEIVWKFQDVFERLLKEE